MHSFRARPYWSCLRPAASLLLLALAALPAPAEEPVDLPTISRIRAEGLRSSQVMQTLEDLVDRHGPRLAASTGYRAAAEWCRAKLEEWGLENARLDPWGSPGRSWELRRFRAEMIEPYYLNLIAFPKAWTSSTDGVVSGPALLIDPTAPESAEQYKGKLRGAVVLSGEPIVPEASFEPEADRYTDAELEELYKVGAATGGRRRIDPARREEFRARREQRDRLNELIKGEGIGCILEPSRGADGTMFVQSGGSRAVDAEPAPPALVVAAEHYGLIARLVKKGVPVKLEVLVEAQLSDQEVEDYNVLAEIPGVDPELKDEVVMLGGHLDSWHAATGTTDNAAGCAVAMEAVRILKAIGVQPRRTIRVALWGAEEVGLLGSAAYVKKTFGDRETMELTHAHSKFSGYFNLDNGTGRIRGIYCQSNDAVRPIFEAWLAPFHDLEATTATVRDTGGTDHQSFDRIGLPGFQFIQDAIDYDTRTHHTNMDTYERAQGDDLRQASVVMASFVYHAAMRNEKLPRKPLPAASPRRGEGGRRGASQPASGPAGEDEAEAPTSAPAAEPASRPSREPNPASRPDRRRGPTSRPSIGSESE